MPANKKTSDEDSRGAPKGSFGQPPFVATDEMRAKVRQYAKVFPPHAAHMIARLLGISKNTLYRHFDDDMEMGRAEMLATVGGQLIQRAIDADAQTADGKAVARGDLDAQKFILARLGGWTTKVEVAGRDGGPIQSVDLSKLSAEQLEAYGRLAAAAEGRDPDEIVGSSPD
jgi:AcrR family transcriptional regulator